LIIGGLLALAIAGAYYAPGRIDVKLPPVPKPAISPTEHLEVAKLLLKSLTAVDYDRDIFISTELSEHLRQAEKDPRLVLEATQIEKGAVAMRQAALEEKIWNSNDAETTARQTCRHSIEDRLKAPSTAQWGGQQVYKWPDNPGFLINQTLDAQNSFGALLRATYQCTVECRTESFCSVIDIDTLR
jgi:hypothetical protein